MLNFDSPKNQSNIIKVLGVGGGGGNAVNHMFKQGIKDVDFILCNTDNQHLEDSPIPTKIQLGSSLTEGRGAGSKPAVGRNSAIENIEEIKELLGNNTKMLFITAGMGGGTGTGAAPIIAEAAKELDILTVAIVTLPFAFEGRKRTELAKEGIAELKKHVDTILVINNDKLRELYGNLSLSQAFGQADNVLTKAAKGIAEIITVTGYINVDFEDVNTVMKNSGVAIMGAGIAEGENRAILATEQALSSPLLNDNDINGTTNMLLYIASGENEISMDEVSEITEIIQDHTGHDCEVIWGSGKDPALGEGISITLIATGFDRKISNQNKNKPAKKVIQLNEDAVISKDNTDIEKSADTENTIELIDRPKSQDSYTATEKKVFNLEDSKENLTEIGNFDFEPSKELIIREIENIPRASSDEDLFNSASFREEETREINAPSINKSNQEDKHKERLRKLRELSYTGKQNFEEMEKVPAYKRKNINLSQNVPSTDSEVARFTLSDSEDGLEIKSNNKFLHDNVD
ncbi:MAG: cell division protein FtsZ [Bacteroidales bacterium]|jgi:cell division protein FtsZ|nr:cell division protein FtsZ [Bacteroidales bacterium]